MDGVKRIRTKGGIDLARHKYTKPPLWGNAAPWELYLGSSTNKELSRSGRRTWDLSWSHLQAIDLFGAPQLLLIKRDAAGWDPVFTTEGYEGSLFGGTGDEHWNYNILTDPSFYSQVIHKTNGGQLPFVFQPDNTNNNDWAICKFDMKSFTFTQVSNGVYNMRLKIKEIW